MSFRTPMAVLAGVLLVASQASAQGDLRRIRSAIHPGPKYFAPEPTKKGDNRSWFGMSSEYSGIAGASLGPAVIGVAFLAAVAATSPFWVPHAIFDAGFDERGWFPAHPHVLDDRPYMVIGDCPRQPVVGDDYFDPSFVKPWSLRFAVDGGGDFDDLSRLSGQLFLDTSIHRLGLLANWTFYRENVPGGYDEALMADYNLTWRITQSEHVLMHVGAGLRTWTFQGETDPGFNFLYRADVFPINQAHCSSLVEIGNLRDTFLMHLQLQAGFTFGHGEVFAGYDFLRIQRVNLHGPMAGVRLWF